MNQIYRQFQRNSLQRLHRWSILCGLKVTCLLWKEKLLVFDRHWIPRGFISVKIHMQNGPYHLHKVGLYLLCCPKTQRTKRRHSWCDVIYMCRNIFDSRQFYLKTPVSFLNWKRLHPCNFTQRNIPIDASRSNDIKSPSKENVTYRFCNLTPIYCSFHSVNHFEI